MFIIAKSQEPTAWRGPEISIIVDLLLSHSVDTRPKVRKSAQGFIVSLISEEGQAVEVARSFIESKVMSFSSSVFKSCTGTETVTALQLLGMIRDVSPFFSAKAIQSIAQNLVKMLSSDNGKMSQHVYSCLDSMMQVGEEDGETVWSEKLLSRIIAAGVSSRPNVLSGSESIVACFRFLLTAVAKLQERSSMAAAEAASLVFGSVSDYMLPSPSGSDEIAVAAANLLCDTIDVCIKSDIVEEAAANSKASTVVESVVSHAVAAQGKKGMTPRVQEEVEKTLGAVIVNVGPEHLLAQVPLFSDPSHPDLSEANNVWLLPAMKKHVRGGKLGFFVKNLLPLAEKLRTLAIAADEQGRPVEAKNLMMVFHQVWGLLPSFMLESVDIAASFPSIAKTLGGAIESDPSLRPACCHALLNGIRSMRTLSSSDQSMEEEEEEEPRLLSAEEAAASLTCLASFAKNYLPILFNTISSSSQEERPLLLETVGEYAKITESSRLNGLFQNVMKKLLTAAAAGGDPMTDEPELEANKVLLLELSLALMPALDEASSEFLFKSSTPFLSDPSGSVQKRAYKLLQLMGEEHTSLMQRKIGDLQLSHSPLRPP
ncbi:hypothetical protein GUITHDRAFT_134032 [Guillardia theta CCMP2712]|uniref:Uncharacterized protein n=1 Tax=Guillardia theta (strain CCMP2712) TaxID=905079 RepID=L1JUW4_GUITC|nr:hypothetical protein GUITHDRAFT_134032 [Guillardia theta CCMP2712]EKX52346.1 hypothetical protein GUITHDRAFT_134032 [Guillardia theta CCMP2712]|eukprot:XP_005839326.1 hypothetical protein GUITHDRAFT_134032 [Guillardia theta CCMP2712]